MEQCEHKLVPMVYGYLYGSIMEKIHNHEAIYGGYKKDVDSADWFCLNCLEDVYL